jgi:hypothetical protein
MRFPPVEAVRCAHHGIDCDPIERWMNNRGGQPRYARMCQLIIACEASGVVFQEDTFFMKPKVPE